MTRHALLVAVAPRAFDNGYTPTPEQVQQSMAAQNRRIGNVSSDALLIRSPDNAYMLPYWDQVEAICDGIHAMRDAGELFMRKFVEEDDATYKYRLSCTTMTNVYYDVVEGLSSKPFEQEAAIVEEENKPVPQALLDFVEDVDGSGSNFNMFAASVFFRGINAAIDWIFIDSPVKTPDMKTQADAKRVGFRPYWSHVLARNVLWPVTKVINGKETLVFMRVFEPGTPNQVRQFERLENGSIVWTLYKKGDVEGELAPTAYTSGGKTFYVEEDGGTLEIDVIPLVPFYTGRRDGRSFKFIPPMRSAADLQVELYLSESALKYVKTLAAYPMLSGNGVKPDRNPDQSIKKLAVGPGRVLYAPPNGDGVSGSWQYVEPGAQSMKFLADENGKMINQLRELGRQPLTAQSGGITVISAAFAANKAKSAVAAWAGGLRNALENAVVITDKFLGIKDGEYDPVVFVYQDFDEFVDGKDLETLDADRERGDISRETLLEEKKRRGVYGPEFTIERENERLLAEVPSDTGDDVDPKNPTE